MSLGLSKGIEDYAKSNLIMERLAMDYHLDVWVAEIPRLKKKLHMLFEVWIGSVFLELRLWDINALEPLEEFFIRLWAIRFRDLQPFSDQSWTSCWKLPPIEEKREDVKVICEQVSYPDSRLNCAANITGMRSRKIGFLATATYMHQSGEDQDSFTVFHHSEEKARDLASRLRGSNALRGKKIDFFLIVSG